MMMRRRLACCTREREFSIDYDEQERIMTYNGLESCIIDSHSYDNQSGTSRGDECVTDSFDGDDASSCSSSNNASGSFSSLWTIMKKDDQSQDEWTSASPRHCHSNDKTLCNHITDVETMKEKFAKLLLGGDVTGGSKGISTALALSNAISNLAASVFGELWKLEPLTEEIKFKWRTEMDWLISPTNYMIELVPSKQDGANGRTLEIMTPKARADIFLNLPALQKLDSMLIETLDSMVETEFWYDEMGSRGEGRSRSGVGESKRWWLPSPRVPNVGLSDAERKRLLHEGKLVFQVFKAAKSINENVLDVMPIPMIVKDTFQKSGKANLGEELYKILTAESISADEMINCLYLNSEHSALEAINKLEAAIFIWRERMTEHSSGKSPVRTPWLFVKEPTHELDALLNRAEILIQHIKTKHPNLPQTFLDVTKVQYGKDVGHSIIEAYSRILVNLAFRILSRVGDVLQEDVMSTPNSPVAMSRIVGARIPGISDSPLLDRVRHSLVRQLNSISDDVKSKQEESKISASPSASKVWCIGKEACHTVSAQSSP